jgi:transcriptional regulator with XRE-family HTH domain
MALVDKGITQTTLAKRVPMHESRLSRIIRGHDDATDDEKARISRRLRKPIAELFPDLESISR